DLKSYAKIHTGNRPYFREFGKSFARHDALTRHRQRRICIGGFDGTEEPLLGEIRATETTRPHPDRKKCHR
ncbi:hypothetical protein EDB80DRAFT_593417, partial [Ilyonectria destructans]